MGDVPALKILKPVTNLFKTPKQPAPAAAPPVPAAVAEVPEEPAPGVEALATPEGIAQATSRAEDAARRKNRKKLRIPLSSSVGSISPGSGLSIN